MVEIATRNAEQQGLANQVRFCIGDVTKLGEIAGGGFDLACFTDAAHHIPDLETVSRVLGAMDRITRPDGLVMAMDLVRLKSRALTEHYVNVLGHDYVDRGLPDFLEDFRNSMYAAWNTEELRTAIPGDTGRQWVQVVPRGLPTVQVVLGLPTGRKRVFVRRGVPWKQTDYVILPQLRSSWRIMRLLLGVAAIRCI
jgi:SAM-dependent methyltransferase